MESAGGPGSSDRTGYNVATVRALPRRALLALPSVMFLSGADDDGSKQREALANMAGAFMKDHAVPGLSVAVAERTQIV